MPRPAQPARERVSRRRLALALTVAGLFGGQATAQTPDTLRLDFHHTGAADSEAFTLDAMHLEGPWPGPAVPIEGSNLGAYRFEVRDSESGKLLASRGYATVFSEWRTTEEARSRQRTFHESIRFPLPAAAVDVTISRRTTDNKSFSPVWSGQVDPSDVAIDRKPLLGVNVWAIEDHGPPAEKLDLLLLGDGYAASDMEKWHADARRLVDALFAVSPFRERRSDFNVWAIDTPAEASGVSRPSQGIYRRSPVGASYDALGMERYILVQDSWQLYDIAAAAPYDALAVVVNERKYGGGGIFGLYATAAADTAWSEYVFVHELGHHIAGLADEYFTSAVSYQSGSARPEPWEPNVTADPSGARWAELLTPNTPLPTPWPSDEYTKISTELQARRAELRKKGVPEGDLERLFDEERRLTAALLSKIPHAHAVGAFEGAMYEAKGYFRSQADCIMFSRNQVGFCAACRKAIDRIIDLYAR